MHKPYYGAYIYMFGTGFVGVRFGTGKGISTWEPINDRLHEDFINNYAFMNVYNTLKKIKDKMEEYVSYRMSEAWIREHYLNLLLKYHMSHMSVYMWPYGKPFISRLDCLNKEQFIHLIHVLDITYRSDMRVWECKLGDLDTFAWKGV